MAVQSAPVIELKPVAPAGAKPVGPYSPGIMAGDYLYVSGQGARDASGAIPQGIEAQTRQCLENIKAVVEAAGLTLEHVVYAQAYLSDIGNYEGMNKVYAQYFPSQPPARSTIGVARMPVETPVEISVVAVRDKKMRKKINLPEMRVSVPISPGVLAGDRFYLSGILGHDFGAGPVASDPKLQVRQMITRARQVLKSAGLELRHLIYANVYVDSKMPRELLATILNEVLPDETAVSIVPTVALPFGTHIEMSGVAGKDSKRFGECTSLGSTVYCKGRGGETADILGRLKADLDAAKSNTSRVVAANVYVDDIDNFGAMNKIYATFFGSVPPTRTTVQPLPKGAVKTNQISLIAVQ